MRKFEGLSDFFRNATDEEKTEFYSQVIDKANEMQLKIIEQAKKVKKMIYVTEMLRWGDNESHHYILGAYSTNEEATYAGEVEKTWRGGKYEYQIVPVEVDKPLERDQVEHHENCY